MQVKNKGGSLSFQVSEGLTLWFSFSLSGCFDFLPIPCPTGHVCVVVGYTFQILLSF